MVSLSRKCRVSVTHTLINHIVNSCNFLSVGQQLCQGVRLVHLNIRYRFDNKVQKHIVESKYSGNDYSILQARVKGRQVSHPPTMGKRQHRHNIISPNTASSKIYFTSINDLHSYSNRHVCSYIFNIIVIFNYKVVRWRRTSYSGQCRISNQSHIHIVICQLYDSMSHRRGCIWHCQVRHVTNTYPSRRVGTETIRSSMIGQYFTIRVWSTFVKKAIFHFLIPYIYCKLVKHFNYINYNIS